MTTSRPGSRPSRPTPPCHDDGDADRVDPEPPWWVGHPVVKYPTLVVLVGAGLAWRVLDGAAEVLVGAPLTIAVGVLGIVASVLLLRGTVLPPFRWARAVSPVFGLLFGAAVVVASVTVLAAEIATADDPGPPVAGGAYLAAGLAVAAVLVQIVSLADTWPDRWRPPYARRPAESDASGAVGEPSSPQASDAEMRAAASTTAGP